MRRRGWFLAATVAVGATPAFAIPTLTSFPLSSSNGDNPSGNLVSDSAGNLYGTTSVGGAHQNGSVFELSGPTHQTFTQLFFVQWQ